MAKFTPPTQEEANEFMSQYEPTTAPSLPEPSTTKFAPPTQEEAEQFMSEYSPTEPSPANLLKVFGQGLTYENIDELLGALRATGKVALGKPELKDWYDIYRKEQQAEQEKIKKVKEAYPISSMGAELAGSFISPINKLLLPAKVAGAAPGVLKAIEEGAITGAKIGLASGVGGSEKTIEKPEEYLTDILSSGATGGAFGAGMAGLGQAVFKGIPALAEQAKQAGPLRRNIITAFEKPLEGKGFISESSEKRIEDEIRKLSGKFGEEMYGVGGPLEQTSLAVGRFINDADKAGAKIDFSSDFLDDIVGIIENLEQNKLLTYKSAKGLPFEKQSFTSRFYKILDRQDDIRSSMASNEVKTFLSFLDDLSSGNMPPSEAYSFGTWLQGGDVPGFNRLKGSKFAELIQQSPQLATKIKQAAIESAENKLGISSKDLFDKFKSVRSGTVETLLNKARPEELSDVWQSDYSKTEVKKMLYDQFKNMINDLSDPSTMGTDSRTTIRVLQDRINDLNNKYPDLKLNFNDLIEQVKDISSQKVIRQKLVTEKGKSAAPTGDLIHKLSDLLGYGGAATLGTVSRGVERTGYYLTKATDDALLPIAQRLKQTPSLQHLGKALEDGVVNKSSKNAALFMIMQNPEARAIANGALGVEDENR